MHHVTLDRWSRLSSPIHGLDARMKILGALAILVSLVLTHRAYAALFASYALLIIALSLAARLPVVPLALRAALVLPFAGTVAALNLFGGDAARAAGVLGKSYLSACTALLLLAAAPVLALLRGLESLGAPRFLLMVAQFLYRYLFVLSEQAQHMTLARRCRAPRPSREPLFRSAAGAVAVLFARSYDRADRIHRAMLARGFQGHFVLLDPPAWRAADYASLAALAAVIAGLQLLLWNL
jgi:cobalt/nickel transport system permease protein